jgi:hypothetical protein
VTATVAGDRVRVEVRRDEPRVALLAFVHGWDVDDDRSGDSVTVLAVLS